MDIEGIYTLHATPEEVWHGLVDEQMLRQTLPELEKLERLDEYSYTLALHIAYTPLLGTYYGRVRIAESEHSRHSRIIIEEVRDTQNTLSGEAILDFTQQEDTTTVSYQGTIQLHKAGVSLQRTVIKGATKLLAQHFFTALEERLLQQREAKKRLEAELARIAAVQRIADARSARNTRLQQVHKPRSTKTLLHRAVHLLGLGEGDTAQEERWTQRIRRTSYASMLLFLLWVGTRLPRRRAW